MPHPLAHPRTRRTLRTAPVGTSTTLAAVLLKVRLTSSRMRRATATITAVSAAAGLVGLAALPGTAVAEGAPLWVQHVQKYRGGISSGVRAALDPDAIRAQAAH